MPSTLSAASYHQGLAVFVRPERANAGRVFAALAAFGAPLAGLTEADFHGNLEQILQIGVEPSRVDVLQNIGGVAFEDAWAKRVKAESTSISRLSSAETN